MRCSVVVSLLLMLSLPSMIFAQSVAISDEDWTALLIEYRTLNEQLENLNSQVLTLEIDLQRARESQQNSEAKIDDLENRLDEAVQQQENSAMRIADLQRRLRQASNRRDRLQNQLDSLGPRLIELAQSLTNTQVTADNALTVIEEELTNTLSAYERREVLLKWGVGIAVTVAVIEAVVIGVQLSR